MSETKNHVLWVLIVAGIVGLLMCQLSCEAESEACQWTTPGTYKVEAYLVSGHPDCPQHQTLVGYHDSRGIQVPHGISCPSEVEEFPTECIIKAKTTCSDGFTLDYLLSFPDGVPKGKIVVTNGENFCVYVVEYSKI